MRRASCLALLPLVIGGNVVGTAPGVSSRAGTPRATEHVDELVAAARELDTIEDQEDFRAASEKYEDSDNLRWTQAKLDEAKLDNPALFRIGDDVFSHEFTRDDGYGDLSYVAPRRVHAGVRGGMDTFSCSGCHSVGGPNGAGSPTENAFLAGDGNASSTANVRNPPALLGVGIVQALASEMSAELESERAQAIAKASRDKARVVVQLASKGVSFGSLAASPGGEVDVTHVVGVDADLIVRPFGWKGTISRLRRFAEDAARIHFGIQSTVLLAKNHDRPDPAHLGAGPEWFDPDSDGKARELEDGVLTAVAAYLAMLEAPVIRPPIDQGLRERWAHGSRLFDTTGCSRCHVREMPLHDRIWHEAADTTSGVVVIDLLSDGDAPHGPAEVKLFSDLERHAMGALLADAHDNEDHIPRDVFLTRPLWGLAETAPYLHDGRAPTIPDAILAHGGEAQLARDTFAALPTADQADIHVFLLSLGRDPKVRFAR
jgi:hypothetical protein